MKALRGKVAAVGAVAVIAAGGLEAAPADSTARTAPVITNYAVQSPSPLPATLSKSAAESGHP